MPQKDRTTIAARGAAIILLTCVVHGPALAQEPATPADAPAADAPATPSDSATAPEEAAPLDTIPVPQSPPKDDLARDTAPPPMLGEITVTARRTEENMQDVPVAVTALTAADLAREQINTSQDLTGRVPSLQINTNGQTRTTESPTIRGQGATGGTAPGVVIYYNEVPLPADPVNTNQGGPGKFFDLANMQVLKGAQGTLFGRNTTGGALLLQPQRPQSSFGGYVKADYSTYSGQGYEAVINLPLAPDTFMVRAGGKFVDREGFTRDVVNGTDYDNRHYWTARVGVLFRTDTVENYLLGHYTDNKDNGTSYVINAINSEDFNAAIMTVVGVGPLPIIPPQQQPGCQIFNALAPSTNCGQDIVAEQHARDPRHVHLSGDPNTILKTGGLVDVFSWDLSDRVTLRNIASYSFFKLHYRWDLDGSRAEIDDNNPPDDINQTDLVTITEELQLQGKAFNDRLQFVTGGYYESTRPTGLQQQNATALLIQDVIQVYELRQRSISPYAQGTLDLGGLWSALEELNFTAGARYNFDWYRAQSTPSGNVPIEQSAKALTWTAGLDRKFGGHLLFGKASRGYKAGGFATRAVNPNNFKYKPEFVTTFELGTKSDFALGDVPFRINASIYHSDYTNMHRAVGDAYVPEDATPGTLPRFGAAVLNVGRSTIRGFELDAQVEPFTGFNFSASYSFTQAINREFKVLIGNLTPQVDCSGVEKERGEIADFQCIPFQNVPRHQYSLTARYRLPLNPANGVVEGSVTYSWLSRRFAALSTLPSEEPGSFLDPVGLLSGSLTWSNVLGSDFDLQFYGTNLTDKTYRISNSNVWTLLYMQSSIWSEPRILGANLTYRWGR